MDSHLRASICHADSSVHIQYDPLEPQAPTPHIKSIYKCIRYLSNAPSDLSEVPYLVAVDLEEGHHHGRVPTPTGLALLHLPTQILHRTETDT